MVKARLMMPLRRERKEKRQPMNVRISEEQKFAGRWTISSPQSERPQGTNCFHIPPWQQEQRKKKNRRTLSPERATTRFLLRYAESDLVSGA